MISVCYVLKNLKFYRYERYRVELRFTQTEIRHISLSALVLAAAISGVGYLPLDRVAFRLVAVSVPLVLGFVLHELAHKSVAMRYGYFAAYRMWSFGLLLALLVGLTSGGRFLFAAPGAVVILSPYFTPREAGAIGLAGPLINIALAGVFLPLSLLNGLLGAMGVLGFNINLWLAFFNMLPMPPLDGSKVFFWNRLAWVVVELPLLVLLFLLPL